MNLTLAGIMFSYTVLYFDSLWQACAIHSAWNFIQGNILGFEVSGIEVDSLIKVKTQGSVLFTGGEFGVEGSIFSVVALIIICVILHILCESKGIRILAKTKI